jgi:hypothetical protein
MPAGAGRRSSSETRPGARGDVMTRREEENVLRRGSVRPTGQPTHLMTIDERGSSGDPAVAARPPNLRTTRRGRGGRGFGLLRVPGAASCAPGPAVCHGWPRAVGAG